MARATLHHEDAAATAATPPEEGGLVVLVAEQDSSLMAPLSDALRHKGFRVIEAGDVTTFIDRLTDVVADDGEGERIDIVVADISMPGIATFEALAAAKDRHVAPALICTTADNDDATLLRARRLGALAVVPAPVSVSQVLALCRFAALQEKHVGPRAVK
jgi:DNA-binding response OmpR family regulator